MSLNFKKFFDGIRIVPKTSSTVSAAGDVDFDTTSNKMNVHNGTTTSHVVTETHTATLTNKTLDNTNILTVKDTNLTIQDDGDVTKQLKLQASGIATGTTRTLTAPDADTTIVGTDATQVLTNKTLSGNTASSLVNGSGTVNINSSGNITLPNATDTLVGKATTDTLTNKSVSGDTNTISNLAITTLKTVAGNATKFFSFDGSGAPIATKAVPTGVVVGDSDSQTLTNKTLSGNTATTLISGSGTLTLPTTGTVTVPNGTDTLVSLTGSQILTNKTLTSPTLQTPNSDIITLTQQSSTPATPSAFTQKFYTKQDGKAYTLDSNGTEVAIGSGSTGINYISNPDAETNTTGWATYNNTAGTSPLNGTGGTPSVTWTRSATAPLRGSASFLLTKGASNRQGDGVSFAFSINTADKARVLQVSFDYLLSSGTFTAGSSGVDSDVTVWLYDVTNGVVIQPTTYKLFSNSTTTSNSFIGNFQTSSSSTSYRLILHCGSTSASAYTLQFDNFAVAPTQYAYNTVITDWQSYTPTFVQLGTVTGINFMFRMVGSNSEIIGRAISGTPGASTCGISLPPGMLSDSSYSAVSVVGTLARSTVSAEAIYMLATGSSSTLSIGVQNGSLAAMQAAAGTSVLASTETFSIQASVRILGKGVQQQTSDLNDQRIVAMSANTSTTSIPATATDTTIIFTTAAVDTHSSYSTSTGIYTVPVAGVYEVNASATAASNLTHDDPITLKVMQNGVAKALTLVQSPETNVKSLWTVNAILNCAAGDLIKIVGNKTALNVAAANSGTLQDYFNIKKIANPAQISSTETIAASYYMSANFGSAASNATPLNYDAKAFDTHGAVTTGATTWKFTAPSAGLYEINGPFISSGTAQGNIYKNGSIYSYYGYTSPSESGFGTSLIRLNAGDYVDIRTSTAVTFIGGALSVTNNIINIKRVGI